MMNIVMLVKKLIKQNVFFVIMVLITIGILIFDPENGKKILMSTLNMARNIGPMLILMFVLLGFIQVWMQSSKSQVIIESSKGLKGKVFAYLFGTVVCGPIYPGFSLGKMLIEKGGKISTVIILLSVWATTKIALLPFEIKILGIKLSIVRWGSTLILIFFLSILCEAVINGINAYIKKKHTKNKIAIDG